MEIKETKHGRGVFATKNYKPGDSIERSPVVVLSKEDTKKIDDTILYDYYFAWGAGSNQAAIALGNGSLYNHSYLPNARYIKDFDENIIIFVAIKPIIKSEEILVNYNGDPTSKEPLWFKTDS